MSKNISVKRVYEKSEKSDGCRILVDRMWPRGIKKEDANIDQWAKDLAPPKDLISWFHKDKACRYEEFSQKYEQHLKNHLEVAEELFEKNQNYSLITSVKDMENSHIPTLKCFLDQNIDK